MKEDYLWDKSGEIDTEIERLEKKLAPLRFKPATKPLPLPAAPPPPRLSFRLQSAPAFAAAASIALLLLAGGVWLALRSSGSAENQSVAATSPAHETQQDATQERTVGQRQSDELSSSAPPNEQAGIKPPREEDKPAVLQQTAAPRRSRQSRFAPARQLIIRQREPNVMARREQLAREGEQAKAQLILALHIAGDKLSAMQKKIKGEQTSGPIS